MVYKHIANMVTFLRILGVTGIFWMTPYSTHRALLIVVHIYALIAMTDFLDGWLARKLNIVSELGEILDPLADKLLILVFLPLLEMQMLGAFPVFIILSREFAMMALRLVSSSKGVDLRGAQFPGKLKTAMTLPLCGVLLARVPVDIDPALPWLFLPAEWIRQWVLACPQWGVSLYIYIVVAVTIWSFLEYFDQFIWELYVKRWNDDERAAKRSIRAIVPSLFSFINLLCGGIAILFVMYSAYHMAILCILLGSVCDAVDGSIARRLDAFSTFGARLDSFADYVSFGVAPAAVIFHLLWSQSLVLGYVVLIAVIYYAAVHIRLHRFARDGGHSAYFSGLPSPVAAVLVMMSAISIPLSQVSIFILIVLVSSLLMVSSIGYMHLEKVANDRFFRFLRVPALGLTILTILKLLDVSVIQSVWAFEMLFGIGVIYVCSPLYRRYWTGGSTDP